MQSAPTAKVRLYFEDNEANRSIMTLPVRFSISDAAALEFINFAISRIQPLSDAVIVGASLLKVWDDETQAEPASTSDVNKKLMLFYSNGDIFESLSIPSPHDYLFETTGKMANIRADATLAELQPVTTDAPTFFDFLVTPEGDPFPVVFVVGGKAL